MSEVISLSFGIVLGYLFGRLVEKMKWFEKFVNLRDTIMQVKDSED